MPSQPRPLVRSALTLSLLWLTLGLTACASDPTAAPISTPTVLPTATVGPTVTLPSTPLPATTPVLTATPTLTSVPATTTTSNPTVIPTATVVPWAKLDQPVATSGCGKTPLYKPGTTLNVAIPADPARARGSSERTFLLHLPIKYNPDQPAALLLVFHGYGGTAANIESVTGFSPLADRENFLVVYPQGLKDEDGQPFWASIGGPFDYYVDELTFTTDLLNKLQSELCVDAARIYTSGFSNGGAMSNYLACRLPGRFAAAAPVAGTFIDFYDGACNPSRTISLLEIHGTSDEVVFYNGRSGKNYGGFSLPAIPDFVAKWAKSDGCTKGPQTFLDTKEVEGIQYTACRDNALVAHYKMRGLGHVFPNTINGHPGNEVIWTFLDKRVLKA